MKLIVPETHRGLLYRNGRLVEWLEPGKHTRWSWLDELRAELIDVGQASVPFRPELAKVAPGIAWTELMVGASEVAVTYVDGLVKAILRPGRYMLWQLRGEVAADLYDLGPLRPAIPEAIWPWIPRDLVEVVTVKPYQQLLVYEDGKLAGTINGGRALLSKLDRDLDLVNVDTRETERTINAQEVMTSDKVSLRMNIILKYRIVDPVRALHSVDQLADGLYSETQMCVRRAVAGHALDALLEGRKAIGAGMTAEVGARAQKWGVEVIAVDIKDVVLPGDMKALMNRVIEAEKQAAAQVIMRREETAATRSQANTAKMLEANPVLLRLKEMEAIKEIAQSLDQVTLIAGAGDLMERMFARATLKSTDE